MNLLAIKREMFEVITSTSQLLIQNKELLDYEEFCSRCLDALSKKSFGLDKPLLKKSLKSEKSILIRQKIREEKICRRRELFCFLRIRTYWYMYQYSQRLQLSAE